MEFPSHLTQAVLLKRYKRFLAEIVLNNQENRIIYCPNMGIMTGCDILGSRIWFSRSNNRKRKYPDTWELVEVNAGFLVCVNTNYTNQLILEAIKNGCIKELQNYTCISLESPLLKENNFDFCLEDDQDKKNKCFMVSSNITLGDEIHRGFYPETSSERGVRELQALIQAKQLGYRAVLFYSVLHTGIHRIFPADHIDMEYGRLLRQAVVAGVEVLGYGVNISLKEICFNNPVEVCIPARMICHPRSEKSQ